MNNIEIVLLIFTFVLFLLLISSNKLKEKYFNLILYNRMQGKVPFGIKYFIASYTLIVLLIIVFNLYYLRWDRVLFGLFIFSACTCLTYINNYFLIGIRDKKFSAIAILLIISLVFIVYLYYSRG